MSKMNEDQAQVIARIEDLRRDRALNFVQICELLVLLRDHPLHRDYLFRWYREIASGKLAPELVQEMGLKRDHCKHMAGRPRDVQLTVVRSSELSWCTVLKGEITVRQGTWRHIDTADFKRMFPIGDSVRSMAEQRAILEAELAAAPVTHIRREPLARGNLEAGTFTLGSQTVPLKVILAALREMGIHNITQPEGDAA